MTSEHDQIPYVFSLTPLTGRGSGGQRRVIIQGLDLPWRSVIIGGLGFIPAIIVTGFFWVFLGSYAIIFLFIVEGAIFWLLESKSRQGLHLRTYRTLIDKRRSSSGTFFLCGKVVDPNMEVVATIRLNTVLVSDLPGQASLPAPTNPSDLLSGASPSKGGAVLAGGDPW